MIKFDVSKIRDYYKADQVQEIERVKNLRKRFLNDWKTYRRGDWARKL
jgi:hypothetical protein